MIVAGVATASACFTQYGVTVVDDDIDAAQPRTARVGGLYESKSCIA
jgi:hypothetical protein